MATRYTQYTTIEGDRWDNIAYKAYGDPTKFGLIIQANPYVRVDIELPGGLTLFIPIISRDKVNKDVLSPWKQ